MERFPRARGPHSSLPDPSQSIAAPVIQPTSTEPPGTAFKRTLDVLVTPQPGFAKWVGVPMLILTAVVMTAWVISEGRTVTAFRAARDTQGKDTVALLFAVRPEHRPQSRLDIFIWKQRPNGGSEAHGYRLSVERITQLAREMTADKETKADRR